MVRLPANLARPAKKDHLFPELLLRGSRQAGPKQVNPDALVAQGFGNFGEELAGSDHDSQVRRLVADHIGKLSSRLERGPKIAEVTRHAAEVELRHPVVH